MKEVIFMWKKCGTCIDRERAFELNGQLTH